MPYSCCLVFFFFFNDTATTEIYTLSLHDALPIYCLIAMNHAPDVPRERFTAMTRLDHNRAVAQLARKADCQVSDITRSEEHTSELQSRQYLVCRLLLEKKKKKIMSTL